MTDCEDLAYRQIYAYAMRNYLDMPKEHTRDNTLVKSVVKADKAVLREFADLAELLGFKSAKITALRDYPQSMAKENLEVSKPLLITEGPGVEMKRRCGLPREEAYERDQKFAFIHNLHSEREERGEGITSFFVLRWRYFAFFDRPKGTILSGGIGCAVKNSMKLPALYPKSTQLEKERNHFKEVSKDLEDAINPLFVSALENEATSTIQETSGRRHKFTSRRSGLGRSVPLRPPRKRATGQNNFRNYARRSQPKSHVSSCRRQV
jgi:hypothetical protein